MTSKIIVVGGTNGQFSSVFTKLSTLHSKNQFAFAIIAGDLFADPATATETDEENVSSLLDGAVSVPLPTYFTVGRHPLPSRIIERLSSSANEVCENLIYLGNRTTLTTSEGIKIVCLGGLPDPVTATGISKDQYAPFHSETDAKSLRGANTADLLLTTSWPSSITNGSKLVLSDGQDFPTGQQSISDLCSALRPRYHFSTSPTFTYEREPFFHPPSPDNQSDQRYLTRFISLASYGNASKQKWVYAFSIDRTTSVPTISSLPAGTTASPFTRKRALPDQSTEYSRFAPSTSHHKAKRPKRAPPPGPQECFFCLSNPNLATHLIASIGTDVYLTTAKGPLSTSATFPDLPFPSHILIIPLNHSPTLVAIADVETRTATIKEMRRYRASLHSMLQETSKGKLGSVTWEVSRAGGIHSHWQFLPVDSTLVTKGLVDAAFKVEAENDQYPAFESRESTDIEKGPAEETERGDFFRVWIWTPGEAIGGQTQILTLPIDETFRFDLQFGRRVLAKLLGLEGRSQWKDCAQNQEEEIKDVTAFKAAFKSYDFSSE